MNVESELIQEESLSLGNSISSDKFSSESFELESVENEIKNAINNASEDLSDIKSLETLGPDNASGDLSDIKSLETLGLDNTSKDLSDIESSETLGHLGLDLLDERLQEQDGGFWLLEEANIITKEESQLRIIGLLTIIAIFAFFTAIGEMITIGILVVPHVPKIVEPQIMQENLLRYKIIFIQKKYLSNFS